MADPAQGGFDPAYFSVLAGIEERHFWFRARNRVIADAARLVTSGLPPGYGVLEVGCGTGQALPALAAGCPGGRVVGLDLFAEGLAFARTRVDLPLVQADARRPPFARGFQVVGAFDVVEHIEDDVAALRAMNALLVPGGSLLVTVPADPDLWSSFDEESHHCRRYTADGLRDALTAAGFEVAVLTPYLASTFPLLWLTRKLARLRSRQSRSQAGVGRRHAEQELRVVPVVNEILFRVLLAETWWLKRGWTLPFGSSLLAIARRL